MHVNIFHTLNLSINFYFFQLSIKQIHSCSIKAKKGILLYCMIKYVHNLNVYTMHNIIYL